MTATVAQARVEILDPLEGLICTFPCRSVAEAEALLETLITQPENAAYQLRLLGPNGVLLQCRPGEPDASFDHIPVKTPDLYLLLKQKEHWMHESRQEIARSQALREQYWKVWLPAEKPAN